MIDREHDLPISRQAEALGVSRVAVYYKPRPTSAEDLRTMRRLDELHLGYPFAGRRMLRDSLKNREGVSIGRRHVASLMKRIRDRSHLSPSEHQQTRARPQDLPLLAAPG